MNQNQQYGMQCVEFEALLTEAVEGSLGEGQMQDFRSHAAACAICAALFAEASAGYQWVRSLDAVEAPMNLAHNILVATTGVEPASTPAQVRVSQSWTQRLQGWLRPATTAMLQPRFAATAAMAFFSITLMLSLAGVRLGGPSRIDFRPSALANQLEHTYYAGKSRVVRYYDSMRIVYELQARMRELRNMLPEENSQPQPQRQEKKEKNTNNKDISVQPEPEPQPKQKEDYAQQGDNVLLASYALHQLHSPYFQVQRNRRTA
ncbi:MAG: hypothetical protein DMG67_05095 [Acidobacteria bacterium]|nr:MAG: hypothetical protein DMG67_05095 [Acidobacteriota bacterium]